MLKLEIILYDNDCIIILFAFHWAASEFSFSVHTHMSTHLDNSK